MSRIFLILSILFVSTLLTNCAGFEVKKQLNELRNETSCEMRNNVIYAAVDDNTYNFGFNLKNVKHHATNKSLKLLTIYSSAINGFKKKSIMMLTLNNSDKLKLTAFDAVNSEATYFNYSPGYMVNGVYVAGYGYNTTNYSSTGYYGISDAEWSKILNAKSIDIAIELQDNNTVKGSFSEDNFENLNKFKSECN